MIPERPREGSFLAFSWLLMLLAPLVFLAPIGLCCHMVDSLSSVSVASCSNYSPFRGCIGLHSNPAWVYFNSITFTNTLFLSKVTFMHSWGFGASMNLFGTHNLTYSTVFLSIIIMKCALLLTKAQHSRCAPEPILCGLFNDIWTEKFLFFFIMYQEVLSLNWITIIAISTRDIYSS